MSESGPEAFPPIRIAVTGGRDITDGRMVRKALDVVVGVRTVTGLAHGAARGVDRIADRWARESRIPVTKFEPDWNLGKKAGPLRNRRMLDEFKPDLLVAFPGGRGTADCRAAAAERGIPILSVDYHPHAKNGYRLAGEIS